MAIKIKVNRRNAIAHDLCTNQLRRTRKHVNKAKKLVKFNVYKELATF